MYTPGLARCTISLYAGFIVAAIEAIEYITYTATSALALSSMILSLMGADYMYTPAVCLLFYISAILIHVRGGWVFWHFNSFLAIISLLIVVIYCLGSLKWVNFEENAGLVDSDSLSPQDKVYFVGGGREFMKMVIFF